MATKYPVSFPCPLINGYRMSVASGVIRSDMSFHQAQRRVFTTMPHAIVLSFMMPVTMWANWQQWVTNNAFKWFEMNLPSMYAGLAGTRTTATLIRFTGNVTADSVTEQHVQVTVTAEMAPSMIGKYLEAV